MPIVPVVNDSPMNTPEFQGTPVAPSHNAAPDQIREFGAMTQSAGLQQMSVGAHIALRIQEQMDDANVKAAETKFIQATSDILHGDNGYLNTKGADALNAYDKASEAIVKAKKDLQESLGNDVQKRMFEQVSQQHLVTFGARMAEHRAIQRDAYSKSESLSRAENMRTMTQNSDLGSEDHQKYLAAGVAEIKNAFKSAGPEAQAKAVRDYQTQVVADDITRLMVDNKYDEAKALLSDQVKAGNVDADAANRMRATIQTNVERVEAINKADAIFATRKGLEATDLEQLLTKVDGEVKDPELRQTVRSHVMQQFSQARSLQDAKYRDNLNDVVNYKYSHNGSIKGVDPNKWAMLDAKDRYELSRPPAVQTDLNTLYGFITKPDSLTVDNVKAAWTRGLLSKESFISLTERAMSLSKDKTYIQQAGDINTRIDYFASPAGLKTYGTMNDEEKANEIALKYRVQVEIEKAKAQNNGKVTSDQVDQIIKKELTQQTITMRRTGFLSLLPDWMGLSTFKEQKYQFQIPPGAVGIGVGSDGKRHYVDANNNDLGVAE